MDTKNVIKTLTDSLLDEVKKVMKKKCSCGTCSECKSCNEEAVDEALKGDQHKIDANKNGKVDAHDFKLLRKKKKTVAETYADLLNPENIEEDSEQIDELSKETLANYAGRAMNDVRNSNQAKIRWQNKSKDSYTGSHPKTGETVTKSAKEMEDEHTRVASNREKGVRTAIKKLAKEEVENLDELSKGTLGSYINKAANKAALAHAEVEKARHDYSAGAALDHATSGTPSHVRSKAKEVIQQDALGREKTNFRKVVNKITGIKRATDRLTKEETEVELTQEEIDRLDAIMASLDEKVDGTVAKKGRGRPPKEGSDAWKRQQAAGAAEQDEPRQHPIQQLERIKRDMRGGGDFKHRDGSSHYVSGGEAANILSKYHGLKPAEKESMQKEIHASRDGFKKHL